MFHPTRQCHQFNYDSVLSSITTLSPPLISHGPIPFVSIATQRLGYIPRNQFKSRGITDCLLTGTLTQQIANKTDTDENTEYTTFSRLYYSLN